MSLAAEISARRLASRVGKRMRVLIDSIEEGLAIGRSEGDAPDIDGVVRIAGATGLEVGDWAEVEIVAADSYDLTARLAQ